jgi:hypothetical protein
MRRAPALLLGLLALLAACPVQASASFGLKDLSFALENEDGSAMIEAGAHPFAVTTNLGVNTEEDPDLGLVPEDAVKDIAVHFPPGLVGNPTAVPRCSDEEFATLSEGITLCPAATVIGKVELVVGFNNLEFYRVGLYNLEPDPGTAAKVGFVVLNVPVTIDVGVNPDPPHNLIALGSDVSQAIRFYGVEVSVWGNPASPVHDLERGRCITTPEADSCPVALPERPFLTAPRSCSGPLQAKFETDSWQNPDAWLEYPVESPPGVFGCPGLPFAPAISSSPTTASASAPSGLRFDLDIDDRGLTSVSGTAGSDIKKAEVLLPEGVTLNPSAAEGLVGCSEEDLDRESAFSQFGEGCPAASKVGEVEVETPLLEGKVLHGQVFVATEEENPFGSMIALYMVIKDPEMGIIVTQPGRVELDPETGQVKTTFGEPGFEVPQFPFSHLRFRFREGARGPLITPARCGSYETKAVFTPWANPAAPYTTTASFQITSGPGGAPCPAGEPFDPSFLAGSINSTAGAYSPFYVRIGKGEGQQDLTRFSALAPKGLAGKLAGLGRCSDAAIEAAKQRPGRLELTLPSCPADSRVGGLLGGAGAGSALTWIPGSLYLAGPFAGHPLSIVAITPAVAGPFDVGTVVVREGLDLDRENAEVIIDGSASEPVPQILKGVPVRLRDLRVNTDRPEFTLNPTSCEEKQTRATIFGSGADASSPADDVAVGRSSRFQASSCASLGFKPKLSLKMKGSTSRSGHPSLRSVLTPRPGDANIGKAVVLLPPSEQIDNAHINNPCTRVQFAAEQCPPGSELGVARAFTPLLDQPLEGPVYFRSNGGERELPDIVADLRGQFEIVLVGFVDSKHKRLRTTFADTPDAPVSKFVLNLYGGKKGLLVNNRNLCAGKLRTKLSLTGQNGRTYETNPVLKTSCKGKRAGKKK